MSALKSFVTEDLRRLPLSAKAVGYPPTSMSPRQALPAFLLYLRWAGTQHPWHATTGSGRGQWVSGLRR